MKSHLDTQLFFNQIPFKHNVPSSSFSA